MNVVIKPADLIAAVRPADLNVVIKNPIIREGGGGNGLVYETGIYTPTEDIQRATISFSDSHMDRPFCVVIGDTGDSPPVANSVLYWIIVSFYDFSNGISYATGSEFLARSQYAYKTSGGATYAGNNMTEFTGATTDALENQLTNTSFTPFVGSSAKYFRNNRSYKWIAVWKPTT